MGTKTFARYTTFKEGELERTLHTLDPQGRYRHLTGSGTGRSRSGIITSHVCTVTYPDATTGTCRYLRGGPNWHIFRFEHTSQRCGKTATLPVQNETERIGNTLVVIEENARKLAEAAFYEAVEREKTDYFRRALPPPEVGKRAVTVDALVYRLVCTNGLIRKVGGASLLHQRHIALSRPEFLQSVQQAVHEALAHSAAYLDRLAASVAYPIPNVERALHKIALDWGLTQATEEAVKKAMLLEKPSQHETLYGLINGLTSVARNMAPDERYTLETQAGQLLEDRLKDPTGSAFVDSASLVVPVRYSDNVANGTNGNGRIAPIARNGVGEPQSNQVGLFALP